MATVNPFDLLGGDDNDDPSHLIATAQQQKVSASGAAAGGGKKSPAAAASAATKMPTKPVPPSQAVREARNATNAPPRGGAGGGGSGLGRGRGAGRGQNRDFGNVNENSFTGVYGGPNGGIVEEGDGGKSLEKSRGYPPRQSFRGGRRGGYGNVDGEAGGDSDRPQRRVYERRSGTGRGYEMKREGSGRANWGTVTDDVIAQVNEDVTAEEKVTPPEQQLEQEDGKPLEGDKDSKENPTTEEAVKPEDKEMTLNEYEKIKEEKRKALLAMKAEERKVTIDKELESMKQLSTKKGNDEVFVKLGSEKESKRKDAEREERAKKSLSINEFLKPAEGERQYGRGRGRGRVDRGRGGGFGGGGFGGGVGVATAAPPASSIPAPAIEDAGQFPTLGGK